jgi:hypothetical protein
MSMTLTTANPTRKSKIEIDVKDLRSDYTALDYNASTLPATRREDAVDGDDGSD